MLQIHEKARNLLWYSLALNESTDLSSMSQLLVFIHGVNLDFQITEELASVCSMHGTTTRKDIFMEVQKTLQDYNLQWNQLRGVTVDVALKKIELIHSCQILPGCQSCHFWSTSHPT